MLPESESAKLVVMVFMVMISCSSWSSWSSGQTGKTRQPGQKGQTDLTFKLDFPGNLRRQFSQILYMVWYGLLAQPGKRESGSAIDNLLAQSRSKEILTIKK